MADERLTDLRRAARTGLGVYTSWDQDQIEPASMGRAAQMMLAAIVECVVLATGDDVEPLVDKAHAWLLGSIARGAHLGDDSTHDAMLRAQAMALSSWLLGLESGDSFRQVVRLKQEYLITHHPSHEDLLGLHLPDLVRDCPAADRPALGAEIYRRLVGPPPASSATVRTPLELAGWLCADLSSWRTPSDWVHVGERVLDDQVLDMLEGGEAVELALWLKLVYADSGAALTATEALRRGGQLIGAQPADPLARLLLDSLGDPVDLDLFTGFLVAVVAQAMPGASAQMLLEDAPDVIVPPTTTEPGEGTPEMDRAVAAALSAPWVGDVSERLAAAVRGRLVAVDGETLLTLRDIRIG